MSRKTTRNSLGAVEKLIEQRRLFQDWLAKLGAGVEAMPPRVVERVRNDYRGRLQKVLSELAEQQDAVREALGEAEGRHAALEEQCQAKREELAELKLRRHVGEVDDADFRESNALLKQAIDGLTKELGGALRDIERYEEILEVILRDAAPEEPEAPPAGEPEASSEDVAPEAEPTPVPEEEEEPEVVLPLLEEPVPAAEPPAARAPAAQPAEEDELAFLRSVTSTIAPAKPPRGSKVERARAERPEPPPPPPPPALEPEPAPAAEAVTIEPSPSRRSAEMQAPVLEELPNELVAAAHMVDLPAEEEPPQAAEAQPEAEDTRGLVCAECGTKNRPTEWYCEKCGAELSAL